MGAVNGSKGSNNNMLITHLNFAKGFRGGERQTQLLIQELADAGYKQRLLVRKNSELTSRCKNIKNLDIIEISKPYILHVNQIKNTHILHAHETKALQFAYFAKKITKTPYIVTRRVDNPIKQNFLNTKMYAEAKVCVALSSAIKKEILKVSKNANIKIIPSAFSDTPVNEIEVRKIKKRFSDKFLIGHIGALVDIHKGQKVIIELAKELEISHPKIHFLLVGGGSDEEELRNMAKELTNLSFEGFVNNVNDYIASFDMFIFPSRNEGLGSTLLDVMNIGVPIIASNVGGIPDIIQDGKNGVLFDLKDIQALKSSLLKLYKDKEFRELLTAQAKKTITNYSASNMAQSYISLYKL